MTTWREHAAPLIAKVIAIVGTADQKALRKALREAYPWGVRKMHPYKIWCSEVRVQLEHARAVEMLRAQKMPTEEGQGNLF